MNIQPLIDDLQRRGVCLLAEGDKLRVMAPRGTLTPELRVMIAENKQEILVNRMRFESIKRRVTAAMDAAERMKSGRFQWDSESDAAVIAYQALEQRCCEYVAGDVPVESVEQAFREYLRSITRKELSGETTELFSL